MSTKNEFEISSKKIVYQNPWMTVCEYAIIRRGMPGIYGVVYRQDTAVIIPVSKQGNTILLKQFRYPTSQYSWELPMGGVDDGESPEIAAKRELEEETGLHPNFFNKIGEFYAVPGLTPQRVFVYLAEVTDQDLYQAASRSITEDEIAEVKVISVKEMYSWVEEGKITDGFTLGSLLFLYLTQVAT